MENQEMLLDRAAQIAPVIRMLALEDGKNTVKLLRCEKAIGAGMNIPVSYTHPTLPTKIAV